MVNAVGLDNPGFDVWKEKHLKRINQNVILSVAGNSLTEIKYLSVQLAKTKLGNSFIKGIEFNPSCPNVNKKWDLDEIFKAMENFKRTNEIADWNQNRLSPEKNYLGITSGDCFPIRGMDKFQFRAVGNGFPEQKISINGEIWSFRRCFKGAIFEINGKMAYEIKKPA